MSRPQKSRRSSSKTERKQYRKMPSKGKKNDAEWEDLQYEDEEWGNDGENNPSRQNSEEDDWEDDEVTEDEDTEDIYEDDELDEYEDENSEEDFEVPLQKSTDIMDSEELVEEDYEERHHTSKVHPKHHHPGKRPGRPFPSNPQHILKEIERRLKRLSNQLGRLTKDNQHFQQLKDTLETEYNNIKDILNKYKAALEGIENKKSDRILYTRNKTPMIEAAVKNVKVKIHQAINGVDNEIAEIERELKIRKRKRDNALSEFQKAEKYHQQKLDDFNEVKNRQQIIGTQITEMENLEKEIEQDEEEREYAVMYFKIQNYNDIMEDTNPLIVKNEIYKYQLNKAWFQLAKALKILNEATIQKEDTQIAYDEKQDELQLRKENRDNEIIELLKEIDTI